MLRPPRLTTSEGFVGAVQIYQRLLKVMERRLRAEGEDSLKRRKLAGSYYG